MNKLLLMACLLSPTASFAQSYTVDWYKIAGGGGTSTNGVYSLSGTIGQPDAGGESKGGNFSITGGFWSLYAVQSLNPGAPVLNIRITATNTAIVSWPSSATYDLQVAANVTGATWTTPPEIVTDSGGIKYIIVNPSAGKRFYRLSQPVN